MFQNGSKYSRYTLLKKIIPKPTNKMKMREIFISDYLKHHIFKIIFFLYGNRNRNQNHFWKHKHVFLVPQTSIVLGQFSPLDQWQRHLFSRWFWSFLSMVVHLDNTYCILNHYCPWQTQCNNNLLLVPCCWIWQFNYDATQILISRRFFKMTIENFSFEM